MANKGDLALLENLVKKNPEALTERDETGATPLHHAAAGGYITLIQFITTVVNPEGRYRSAELQHIYISCHLNRAAFAVLLITYIWDVFGSTPFSTSGINSGDDQGNVPLHCAVEKNKAESCRALLDLGADPNILNVALMAPLHLAVSLGHNNLVEVRQPGNKVSGCFI